MKSIDQTWLIASGTDNGSGRSRTSRFFGLIRRFNSSSR
ncbi:transposase [Xanthomonas citri pv. citri]|nr:transposase [Xanthomonas citri pv. citri]